MSSSRKILYIQHAAYLGGSCMSLLYTMQGLDRLRFEPIVALARPSTELVEFYDSAGFEILPWKGMMLWDHSTVAPKPLYDPRSWFHLGHVWLRWSTTQRSMLELIDTIKPDLVHLNSMPLSACAQILNRHGIPFVWHIREPPPDQGLRTRMIRRIMMQAPRLIFLSEYDRQAWVNGYAGDVVHNFVDLETFNPAMDGRLVRRKMDLAPEDKVILFLGGKALANGILVLFKALRILQNQISNLVCLIPGASSQPAASWQGRVARKLLPLLGSGTLTQKIEKGIREKNIETIARLLPFSRNIPELIAASDLLVVPATLPHFARPVVEAAAMAKPVVGSNLGGVKELIEHERTGILVKPGSPSALAAALKDLLTNPAKLNSLGENALKKARNEFDAKQQIAKITEIYDSIPNRFEQEFFG